MPTDPIVRVAEEERRLADMAMREDLERERESEESDLEDEIDTVTEDRRLTLRQCERVTRNSERLKRARANIDASIAKNGKKRVTVQIFDLMLEAKTEYEEVIQEILEERNSAEGKVREMRGLVRELMERLELKSVTVASMEKELKEIREGKKEREDSEVRSQKECERSEKQKKKEENRRMAERQRQKALSKKTRKVASGGEVPAPATPKPVLSAATTARVPAAQAQVVAASKAGGEAKPSDVVKEKESEDGFTKVNTRRWEKKGVPRYVPPMERKKRVETTRTREPRTFLVEKGEGTVGERKERFWKALGGEVKAPRLRFTKVLPRGDLLVESADEATFKALLTLESRGEHGVRRERLFWPKVLVYDVDRDIEESKLSGLVRDQNPELTSGSDEVEWGFTPRFRSGAKDGQLVNWVVEVSPTLFKRIVSKRVCVGMGMSRVVEYGAVLQCNKCLRYGHMAARCPEAEVRCGRCAKTGHKSSECKSEGVRCTNCGLAYAAGHRRCQSRLRAERLKQRRTDFGAR